MHTITLGQRIAHAAMRYTATVLIRAFFNVRIVGAEKLPSRKTGGIIAANHISDVDSIFIPALFNNWPLRMLAKASIWDNKLAAAFVTAGAQIPIRGSGTVSDQGLDIAADWLRQGGKVGVFPEGTRNRHDIGMVHRGRTGIARLLLEVPAPVYPVAIEGTDKVKFHKPKTWRNPVTITVGDPIRFDIERYDTSTESLSALTRTIMESIAKLGNFGYVDTPVGRVA